MMRSPNKKLQFASIAQERIYLQKQLRAIADRLSGLSLVEKGLPEYWLDRPLGQLQLQPRAENALVAMGVATVGELAMLEPDALLQQKNIGKITVYDIYQKLVDLGFTGWDNYPIYGR